MKELLKNAHEKYKNLSLPLRASMWFTITNFLQRGVSMLTTPLFTRLLSKEQYGIASTFTAWQSVLTLVCTLSLYKALMNLFKDCDDYDKVVSSVSSLSIVVSCGWVIIGIAFSSKLSALFGFSQLLTIGLFISFIPEAIINCWAIGKRYKYAYRECIIQSISTIVGSTIIAVLMVIFISPTAESKTLPAVVVSLVVSIILYFSMMRRNSSFYDEKIWTFSLTFCIALLPHYLSEFVLQSSDKLMINAMCGAEDVAIYSIAYSVGSLINLVISAVNSTVIPYRYQRLKDKNYAQLADVSNKVLLFVAVALMGIMLLSPEIIYFFGGEQYAEAKHLVIPICIGVFFNFVFQLFSTVQEFYERKKTVVLASVLCAISNIILNYIFIKICGYQAAAYTTFSCYMMFSFLHYLFYRKVCKEELGGIQIYNIKGVLLISLSVIIGGIIIAKISSYFILKYTILVIIFMLIIILGKKYFDKRKEK